ncbi:homeobox protein 21, ZINC FINGER HOMEODOMAIN 3, ZINC FINGER HOMEODOMAIN 4 [Hibiscus trionum]|uniref:Homeobox protein 21, ZINC FINGER HOMEODOMAIN 3, ZINC FINGER HOMEODOMAIN 4 n=1 Tax=Hibiscus trionum TaxID=183268 RepID=A0A9W7IG03_HIBTR|nr:homeobox protein 21, ZINC FINGER HOMEODOMAIN 3, ZINC FINGER HOMEODOMAIN 4 [Hibiscus trionum]
MELSSQEGEIPIPLNNTYGGGHGHGHGHGHMVHHDPAAPQVLSNGPSSLSVIEDHVPYKKPVRYRECLKNHAAAMGGNATDGCGEFMPSGEEGTIEALTCSACHCHRNFHRKEVEGEPFLNDYCYPLHGVSGRVGRKLLLGHPHGYPTGTLIHSRAALAPAPTPHQMIMSYNMGGSLPSESDEQPEDGGGVVGGGRPLQLMKKRFRTKFNQEQKDKMLNFAEKVGWKIQKQEESVVQQFCQEIGVKRRVLKVWMHNNKHNLAKKNPSDPTTASTAAATTTTTAAC